MRRLRPPRDPPINTTIRPRWPGPSCPGRRAGRLQPRRRRPSATRVGRSRPPTSGTSARTSPVGRANIWHDRHRQDPQRRSRSAAGRRQHRGSAAASQASLPAGRWSPVPAFAADGPASCVTRPATGY
jgi:hypothetical protein